MNTASELSFEMGGAMNDKRIDIEAIARALGKSQRSGTGLMCCCPAHEDSNRSLSLKLENSKLLVRCSAGCEPLTILSVLRRLGLFDLAGEDSETIQSISENFFARRDIIAACLVHAASILGQCNSRAQMRTKQPHLNFFITTALKHLPELF